jgi:hypothetical protein
MSNYQEGGRPYEGQSGENPSYGEPSHGGSGGYQGGAQGGAPQYETSQFGSTGGQQQWGPHQGYQGQGGYSGGPTQGRNLQVRSTFMTTEFWIFVVLSLAVLIASAVSDDQGFAAQEAWKYVTWLAIAYMISRGLTKFGGHERGRSDRDRP